MNLSLCEAHLVVHDLDASEAFYRDALGLSRAFRSDDICFMWTGPSRKDQIGLWRMRGGDDPRPHTNPDVSRIARQHLAFCLAVEDLPAAVRHLREKGVRVQGFESGQDDLSVHAWVPAVSAYFSDPDGHALELYARLPDAPEVDEGVVPWRQWEERHGRRPGALGP